MNRAITAVVTATLLAVVAGCGSPEPQTPQAPEPPVTSVAPSPTASSFEEVATHAPAGWVDLSTVDPTILLDMRYQGSHNFVGRPIDGYLEPVCLLPERTAQALQRVQSAARQEGYSLKVYECYRPMRATEDFVRWRDTTDEAMRAEFYPSLTKRQLFDRGFIAAGKSTHNSGHAVDVSLVRLPAGTQRPYVPGEPLVACTAAADERFPDNSVDMGTGYDCFDARSHPDAGGIGSVARENRQRLRRLMSQGGFTGISTEWWHFNLSGPGDAVDFPVARAAVN